MNSLNKNYLPINEKKQILNNEVPLKDVKILSSLPCPVSIHLKL